MNSVYRYYYGNIFDDKTNQILQDISPLLKPCITKYVDTFYRVLLADKASAYFLSSDIVETRLKQQLKQWLIETLAPKREDQVLDSLRMHLRVGEVHSRIEIPMPLVDTGMTIIKEGIFSTLLKSKLTREKATQAIVTVNKILDAALSLINESYLRGKVSHERTSQEFITASSAQELALEIERVKNSIYKWMTSALIACNDHLESLAEPINKKDFSLWIKHKLPLISTDAKRSQRVNQSLKSIDQQRSKLVAAKQADKHLYLEKLKTSLQELIWHLTEEANANLAKESKQDSLTKLLERRFIDPILQQETQMAINGGSTYSLLMMDLDHFKRVNDLYGHVTGDQVLKVCSKIIKNSIRLTDYAFRYGGEEFLIVTPEMNLEQSKKLAERIRKAIQKTPIEIADKRTINITASIGVSCFSGHPDFLKLINEADSKLYEAKQAGRNCVKS